MTRIAGARPVVKGGVDTHLDLHATAVDTTPWMRDSSQPSCRSGAR